MLAAVIACAPDGSGFEQECGQCEGNPELRERWGCDAPVEEPLAWLDPCPFCEGKSPTCKACKGEGRKAIYRCPNVLVTRRHLDAIGATALLEHGIMPDPGGWQDQPGTWVSVVPLIQREMAHWRAVAMKQAQKKGAK